MPIGVFQSFFALDTSTGDRQPIAKKPIPSGSKQTKTNVNANPQMVILDIIWHGCLSDTSMIGLPTCGAYKQFDVCAGGLGIACITDRVDGMKPTCHISAVEVETLAGREGSHAGCDTGLLGCYFRLQTNQTM